MAELLPTDAGARPRAFLLAQAAVFTIPFIAWSRDVAVVTLVLGAIGLARRGPWTEVGRTLTAPAAIAAGLFLAWSAASVFWSPDQPWEAWLKTSASIVLSAGLALFLAKQPNETLSRASAAVLCAAFALLSILVVELITDGFLIGLHREADTVFQRLTALSGGLVLLCTTCFACAVLLSRYLGALLALPAWLSAVLAVSIGFPMDAEVVAVIAGALVFGAIMVGGRAAAVALMTLLIVGMVGWGFAAESAAGAGLHHWLIANVDPNWGYRVEIWRYVNGLIFQAVWGHGFDASRSLGQSAALMPSFEGKTSFLHPHNGMLQLWLELGLIGITLFVAAVTLGFKAFLAGRPSRLALATVCATVTTTAVIWSLSFGVWQGWWLAVLGLTASCVVLAIRPPPATESKRLLFLVTEYYFFDALKKELTQGAMRQGYEIFVAGRCRPQDMVGAPGITIIPFDWKRSPSFLVSLAHVIPDLVRVGRLLNRVHPDVVHNIALKPSIIGSLAAMGHDIKVINAIHGFGYLFMRRTPAALMIQACCGLILKLSARLNDGLVLLVNRHDLAFARERMGIQPANLRLICGAGIDLDRFTRLPEPAGAFKFLVIGRLLYMKGTDVAVEALRLLREGGLAADMVICGSPDPDNPSTIPESVLAEWTKRPGLTFAGQVADVRPYLASCHVLIHPSLGGEGLPRALTEAAASGRALIATDIPGNTEVVISDRTGLLVPPGDAVALAGAMRWMMEHDAERRAFGDAGRAMMEREFSSERVAQAHAALFREADLPG